MNELRFAFRQLLKNPGFAGIAIVTLALGVAGIYFDEEWMRLVAIAVLATLVAIIQSLAAIARPETLGGLFYWFIAATLLLLLLLV
jgi:hypothetical protein